MKPSISRVVLLPCALALGGLGGCGGQVVTVLATADGGFGQTGATSGSSSGAGGSGSSGTPSGSVDAGPASRCGFAPDPGAGSAPVPSAAADVVLTRIFRFLDDSSIVPPGIPAPPQVTADWAGMWATSILESHLANKTEAPGLVRFLTTWLKVPAPDAGPSAARTWSLKLLDPSATLTTLLAGPTGDPHRIGILTDPQVLTQRGHISVRGQWMAANLFCVAVPDVPPGLPVSPRPPAGMTERQQLESDVSPPLCISCHIPMDPPGDSLGHFDAMGNYRDLDNGSPVDSSGSLQSPLPMLKFTSIDDLAPQLAVSCPVAQCFAKLVMTDAFAVPPGSMNPFTAEEANHVANAFANSNFSIRELVKAIVGTPSFLR